MRTRVNRVDYYLGHEAATRTFFRAGYFYPGDLAIMRGDKLSLQARVTDVINVGASKYATLPLEFALQERLAARAVHVSPTQARMARRCMWRSSPARGSRPARSRPR